MRLDEAVDFVGVDTLVPYGKNPRVGDVGSIAESLEKNGQYRPIVVRAETKEILAGNHTWQAAKSLGWSEIAVSLVHGLTDEEAARIVLVDNRANDLATYDPAQLAELLASLSDVSGTGYSPDDVATLLASLTDVQEPTALTDPDDVPEVPEEAQSRLGDVWRLGRHRLLVGDATGDLSTLMQGDTADLVLTDPPYNVNYEGGTGMKIQNDKMFSGDFRNMLEQAFGNCSAVAQAGAPIYVFHADTERVNFQTAAEAVGWTIRQNLVWVKNTLVMGRQDYHWQHEPIMYGWLAGAAHKWYADRKQTTVLEFDRPTRSELHPTMKPVGLVAYLISNSTQSGGIVLDPFAGSGSTLIACHQTGRTARIVELDPKYADVILRRYMEHTGDTPTLESTGEKFGNG